MWTGAHNLVTLERVIITLNEEFIWYDISCMDIVANSNSQNRMKIQLFS